MILYLPTLVSCPQKDKHLPTMDHFLEFLLNVKQVSASIDFTKTHVHLVMGNESCDLDSMICALGLAYYHHQINIKKSSDCKIVLPILNIPMKEFMLRTENCYVLKQFGINEDHLIFRDSFDLEAVQKHGLLSISIVDHHVLRDKDKFLEHSVIEVYDHRPQDPNIVWNTDVTDLKIEEVGSCATLISHTLLKDNILTRVLAELLYDVIIFDTIAFSLEAQKVRELDTIVSGELQRQFNISCEPHQRFDQLWHVHNDVGHLTPKQLLFKDLKFLENLPIPGLPMLVREYLLFTNVHEQLISFCDEVNSATVVIMGLKVANDEVFRDIAVFSNTDKQMRDALVEDLMISTDLGLIEGTVDVPDIRYFKQSNVKMSRKQIIPLIKSIKKYHFIFPEN